MNEFLLWFIKPIAEFLGVMTLFVVIIGIGILLGLADIYIFQPIRNRKKK